MNVTVLLALTAGILSFLSPCVLPMIPAYLAYLTGEAGSEGASRRLVFKSLWFIIGFTLIFTLFGASASFLGQLASENQKVLRIVGGIVVILFGIHTMGIIKISSLYKEKRVLNYIGSAKLHPVFLGMAFAIGWTPCVGPVLSSILILAGSSETMFSGVILLVFYSLGLGIPFLLSAIAVDRLNKYLSVFKKHYRVISVVSGLLLIVMGVLIMTNTLGRLTGLLSF